MRRCCLLTSHQEDLEGDRGGIECDVPPFNVISRRSTSEMVLSRKKNSASKMANWITVDNVKRARARGSS